MSILVSFLTVGKQVLILFLLMVVGYILGKAKIITEQGSVSMSNVVMYTAIPAMLIVSFQRELIPSDLGNFGMALVLSLAIHVLGALLSRLLIRDADPKRISTLRFAVTFSNCGFMGYPMMTALLGTIGVFYGSAYVVIFNLLGWTWGVYLMTGDRKKLSLRPILLNPGVLGVVIAMALYLFRVTLPEVILTPVTYFSYLNTPVPMLILGYQLSHADFRTAFRGVSAWMTLLLRLILMPLLTIGLCLVLRIDSAVAMALVIAAATPPAALLSLFSAKFDTDSALASSVVSVQTALSVLTMPVLIGLGQYLIG